MADLIFTSAADLARLILEKQVSAVDVLEAHLAQIARFNPQLNAIVTLDEEGARTRAREADAALARGIHWGPLHGVPITVKDALETAGLRTTSSFPPLANYVPKQDATVVARLRSAGAIVLGKTNLPPLCDGPQTNSPLFGRTNNPWDLARTPGGSSGGSAAALAAGFSALDLGSDIGGSLRNPASFCGIFTIKPTDHLVSTAGHIPPPPPVRQRGLLQHLLSVGPLARSVQDLRLALTLIAGPDEFAPEIPPIPLSVPPKCALRQLRLAWTDQFDPFPVSTEIAQALAHLAQQLREAGCQVEQRNPPGFDFGAAVETDHEIQMGAFMARQTPLHLPRWVFRELGNRTSKNNPALRGGLRGVGATLARYGSALGRRGSFIRVLESFLSSYDGWLCPVASVPAFVHTPANGLVQQSRATVEMDGRPIPYFSAIAVYTSIFNLTGNPVVVLPLAQTKEGLPIGVQLVGRRWHDMELLNVAEALTGITGGFRRPPGY